MLRINKQTDYGIVLLAHAATRGAGSDGAPLTARFLAESSGIPAAMVSKTLKLLCREGFLESQRGVNGGYELARPADEICIADIIRATEGPLSVTECGTGDDCNCNIELQCNVRLNWQRLNSAIHSALAGITLSDMLEDPAPCSTAVEKAFSVWPPESDTDSSGNEVTP